VRAASRPPGREGQENTSRRFIEGEGAGQIQSSSGFKPRKSVEMPFILGLFEDDGERDLFRLGVDERVVFFELF